MDSSTTGKMLKGISNFQIKSAIENLTDNDINENFVAVFSCIDSHFEAVTCVPIVFILLRNAFSCENI